MSAVFAFGKRVEIPSDYMVVCTGNVLAGDMELAGGLGDEPLRWHEFSAKRCEIKLAVGYYPCVIRRDPKETT